MRALLVFVLLAVFSGVTAAQVELERGLVGLYSFENEGDTVVVNRATGPNIAPDGVLLNGPAWTDGISGKALLFNPLSTGHVSFGTYDPSAGTDSLSISVWTFWNGLDGRWHSVCGKRDAWDAAGMMWDICLDMNSGGVQFETNTTAGKVFIITPIPPLVGEWMHLAVTFDGAIARIFMGGALLIEGPMVFGQKRDAGFHLGCGTTGGVDPFNGALDEFRIYNRVLSEEEVAALSTITTSVRPSSISGFMLHQNYPNPFNPSTVISYQLPKTTDVTLKVYTMLGEEVRTLVSGLQDVGTHSVIFDGSNLPSGIYFYRLQAGTYVETKKTVLLK